MMKLTYAILGGTGHIGSVLSDLLLKANMQVTIIGHNADKQKQWIAKGAHYEIADILDSEKLHSIFRTADRIFILNPPADPKGDAESREIKQAESIVKALKGLHPQKIVLASTYGAREGKNIFDLGTLYQLEQALQKLGLPLAIIRSAYYMSNFDLPAEMAIQSGKLSTLIPADFKIPMVAPKDIATLAAACLQDARTGIFYIQAQDEYSAEDVTRILTTLSNKKITPQEIPEEKWSSYMEENGFSSTSVESFIGMTRLTIDEKFQAPNPETGQTTLEEYLKQTIKIPK